MLLYFSDNNNNFSDDSKYASSSDGSDKESLPDKKQPLSGRALERLTQSVVVHYIEQKVGSDR